MKILENRAGLCLGAMVLGLLAITGCGAADSSATSEEPLTSESSAVNDCVELHCGGGPVELCAKFSPNTNLTGTPCTCGLTNITSSMHATMQVPNPNAPNMYVCTVP